MITPERQGILIVFEGTDGTGKSTQLQLLSCYLQEQRLSGCYDPGTNRRSIR